MLASLHVKNVALISDVEMTFKPGMNIITGETGAGKSILVGALGLALGNRADISTLRNKQEKCIIEAEFDISNANLQTYFQKHDLDYEDRTILRREITISGKSRSFINDTPVKLKDLNALSSRIIEIHSQHDNLQLFKREFQYQLLDLLANTQHQFTEFRNQYNTYVERKKSLELLKKREADLAKEADFNQFLFDELEAADLDHIDEQKLIDEQELLENAEELITTFNAADQLFSGSDFSIIEQLQSLVSLLKSKKTSVTEQLNSRIASVLIEVQDISSDISSAAQNVEINPERLTLVNEQLALIFNLKNKHHVENVEGLRALMNELSEKLSESNSLSSEIAKRAAEIESLKKSLDAKALSLSEGRKKAISAIEKRLIEDLSSLGMEHSRIHFSLNQAELTPFGIDDLTIELSSDKGNTFSELKKSASGGELARINLCVKNALSGLAKMPTSIFDEIDTGVSGEIARKVGSMMKKIGDKQQVIVITHLPQIASLGSHHLFVYKQEKDGTVSTEVRTLNSEERIEEIAKMISGDNLTEHSVEQSKLLLKG